MKRLWALVLGLCLLVGCGEEPTPTPDLVATQVAARKAAAATLTAESPTATNTPTSTPVPSRAQLELQDLEENPVGMILGGIGGFMLGVVVVGAMLRRRHGQLEQTIQELKSAHLAQEEEFEKKRRGQVRDLKRAHGDQLRETEKAHQAEIQELEKAGMEAYQKKRREGWFEMLRKPPWAERASEVEIETKFVFQLLQFLGYPEDEMEMRTSVPVQQGTMQTHIKADFVIRDTTQRTLLVVEAKAPGNDLDDTVKKQARSYAFQLGAPVYMITNGHELGIYQLGVLEDKCVVFCNTSQLEEHWQLIEETANRYSLGALHRKLSKL